MKYLYLAQHNDLPQYTKIGYTSDLDKRVQQLNTGSPTGIKLIYTKETEYAYRVEQALHARYHHKNTNLEWFNLSEDDIRDIIYWVDTQVDRHKEKRNTR